MTTKNIIYFNVDDECALSLGFALFTITIYIL